STRLRPSRKIGCSSAIRMRAETTSRTATFTNRSHFYHVAIEDGGDAPRLRQRPCNLSALRSRRFAIASEGVRSSATREDAERPRGRSAGCALWLAWWHSQERTYWRKSFGRSAVASDGRNRDPRIARLPDSICRRKADDGHLIAGMAVGHEDLWVIEWPHFVADAIVGQRQQERHERILVVFGDHDIGKAPVDVRDVSVAEISVPVIELDDLPECRLPAVVKVRT